MASNKEIVRGYKVFNPDWTCTPTAGVKKQYTCPGKFEEEIDLDICRKGMHFCKRATDCFSYNSFDSNNKVAEVIAYGKVIEKGDKCCTDKLEIVREIPWAEVLEITNTGKDCTGLANSGDCNSGNWNSGNRNSGNRNSGNWNSGNRNSGDCNSGYYNSGDYNSGDWNKCNYSNGCFNTEEPKINLFNKPSDWTLSQWRDSRAEYLMRFLPQEIRYVPLSNMTDEEKTKHPEAETTGGYLKIEDGAAERQVWWDKLPDEDKNDIKAIPNFDRAIFKEITGIDVKE